MEEIQKIKKILSNMPSADIEIVITAAVRIIRVNAYKEAHKVISMSLDPKTIKMLKREIKGS